jgi:hypothetical protein
MGPTTPQDWLAVARMRGADADVLCVHCPDSIGSVYLAGYVIECSLKALLQKKGIPYSKRGSEGHNLKSLWRQSGLRLSDLKDHNGSKTFLSRLGIQIYAMKLGSIPLSTK